MRPRRAIVRSVRPPVALGDLEPLDAFQPEIGIARERFAPARRTEAPPTRPASRRCAVSTASRRSPGRPSTPAAVPPGGGPRSPALVGRGPPRPRRGRRSGATPPRSTPCRQGASRAPPPRGRGRPASFGAARASPPGHSGWGGAGPAPSERTLDRTRRPGRRLHRSPPRRRAARRRTRRRSNRRPSRISRAAASTSPSESSRGAFLLPDRGEKSGVCDEADLQPPCGATGTVEVLHEPLDPRPRCAVARSPDSPEGRGRESAQRQAAVFEERLAQVPSAARGDEEDPSASAPRSGSSRALAMGNEWTPATSYP